MIYYKFAVITIILSLVIIISCPVFDYENPTVTITDPSSSSIDDKTILIKGTASDNNEIQKIEVKVGEDDYKEAEGKQNWRFSYTFATSTDPVTKAITVRAMDYNNNKGYDDKTITYTGAEGAPTVDIKSHNDTTKNTITSNNRMVSGTVSYSGTLSSLTAQVNGGDLVDISNAGANNWTYEIPTTSGKVTYVLIVAATDSEGRKGSDQVTLTLE